MLIVNAVAMLTRKVGDYIYRVEQPSVALGKTGKATVITVSTLSPWFEALCLSSDVLIVHLLSEHDLLPIIEDRKRQQRPTIYELSDNIISLHSGVGIREWFADPVNLALAFQYMAMADAVQVTGQGLAGQFDFTHSRMVIFENQMDTLGLAGRPAGKRVVVGWAGSSGHKEDVTEILGAVRQVMEDCPSVDFALMGDKAIYRIFSEALPAGRLIYTPPGTLDEYLAFLQTLDIGIAPLQENPYNHCRSDVKFLEYASRGVVPVLRSLTPYKASAKHGQTAFLYESPKQLAEILTSLARDTPLRDRISRAAYAYVKDCRTEEAHVEKRLALYSGLMGRQVKYATLLPEIPLVRCCDGSDYFEVSATHAESLLLEGIRHDAAGAYEDAVKTYQLAAASRPDYALPWFWLGYSALRRNDERAAQWLDEALVRNPRSLRSCWLKAKALKDREPMAAFEVLTTVLNQWPAYAPAAFSMAEILEAHGAYDEAMHWYDETLRADPFFSPAAMGLGRIHENRGETEKAGPAYGAAADLAPAWAEAQYAMARWSFSRGDSEKAADYCGRALMADASHGGAQALSRQILSGQ